MGPATHEALFVGRERELAELGSALTRAVEGQGSVWLLVGEPGVGKTMLSEQLARVALQRGARVVRGPCWDAGGAPAFWPWIQVLRALERDGAGPSAGPDAVRGRLAWLVPELGVPAPAAEPTGPEHRFALFDAVTTFLATAATDRPLVVLVDDLHAADESSLQLLHFVARQLQGMPVLVVATQRDVDAEPSAEAAALLTAIAADGRRLPLRGLSDRDVAALVDSRGDSTPGAALLRQVQRITGGNPYFVDEVVRLLAAEGRLDDPQPGEVPLPDSVRAVIARRLQPLDGRSRRVLDVAAVAGSPFALSLVAEVAGCSRAAAVQALDDAHRRRLVEPADGAGGRYRFAHALVRETLHRELAGAERMALHTAVAETIERTHAASLDEHLAALAFHYREAVPVTVVGKALEYARRAGAHATAQLAHEEAARHFTHALGILDTAGAGGRERCELLLELGAAERRCGQVSRARERFTEAARLARTLQAPDLLARAVLGYSGALGGPDLSTRTDAEVVRLLEEALEVVGDGDAALRAQLLARLALELYYSPQLARRAALSEEAVEAAARSGDPRSRLIALYSRNWSVLGPDRSDEQRRAADGLLALATDSGDAEMRFSGHHFRMAEALERGDLLRVDTEIAECVRLAEALRQPLYTWQAGLMQAMRALLRGHVEEGERLALEAFGAGSPIVEETAANLLAAQLFFHRWITGRLGELADGIDQFAAQWPWIPAWRCAVAWLRAELGDHEAALSELDTLGAHGFTDIPRDGNWGLGMAMVSYTAASVGSRRHAEALLELVEPQADRVTVLAGGFVSVGPLALAAASLAATLGLWDRAEAHMARGRDILTRLEARPVLAFSSRERARLLLARGAPGDAAAAAAEIEVGRRQAEAQGMARLVEQLDELATRLPAAREGAPAPPRESGDRAILERRGEAWAVGVEPAVAHLRDSKGLNHLAWLLAHPGVEFHALELASGEVRPAGAATVDPDLAPARGLGDAGPRLDAEAKSAYRARMAALRAEVAAATRRRDAGAATASQAELDALSAELGAAVGLGGRDRPDASASERARVNVTRAVRQAIARIAEHDERLGHDLAATVRTGTFVSYSPPPDAAVSWRVRP